MNTKNLWLCLTNSLLCIAGCTSNSRNIEVRYLKEGKICSEKIPIDFIKNGQISLSYIDTVKCNYLDSISYPDMNPDHYETHTTPIVLDFSKSIKPYSPEYV